MFGKKKKQAAQTESDSQNMIDKANDAVDASAKYFEEHPDRIDNVLNAFPKKFAKFAGKLPLATEIGAAYYALRDSETPLKVKATLAAALAYFILSTDVIPDFVAGLGFTDDMAVVMMVMNRVSKYIKPEHYASARSRLQRDE